MKGFGIVLIGVLALLAAGCRGRTDYDGNRYADDEWDDEAAAGEEIARYLDETERGESIRFVPAERDPFTAIRPTTASPPPTKIAVKRAAPAPPTPAPRLVGILQGSGEATVRIGDGTYHAGDEVAGCVVVAIGEDHIILERDGKRHTVEVGRYLPDSKEGGIGS